MTDDFVTAPQSSSASAIEASGLFDHDWYVETYPESEESGDPLMHFCDEGWRELLWPNPYFDTGWYARTYGAELLPDENPLLHYIRCGERENAWPSPYFDPEWYRETYGVGEDESPLRHYLLHRISGVHSPTPDFDVAAYVEENPESLEEGQDPYLHWLNRPRQDEDEPPASVSPFAAVLELTGGDPDAEELPESVPWQTVKQALQVFVPFVPFDEEWYRRQYPDVDAAVKCGVIETAHMHFIQYGFFEGRSPAADWREPAE
jgi:hypothetical protein